MSEEINNKNKSSIEIDLTSKIEALLFVSPNAVNTSQIAAALELTPRQIEKSIVELEEIYKNRGLRIQRHRGKIQIMTAPDMGNLIERFLSLEASTKLTHAALETLSIIAYQQPVTRPEVDSIRGVNSDSVIKNMLSKGLIEEVGRSEGPGKPILYNTSPEFLQHFGLSTIKDLPPLQLPESPPLLNVDGSGGKQSEMPLDKTLLKE